MYSRRRGCAVPGKGVQYQERVCSTRKGCAVPGKGVQYQERVCSTRKGCAVPGKGVQYQERMCSTRRKCAVGRITTAVNEVFPYRPTILSTLQQYRDCGGIRYKESVSNISECCLVCLALGRGICFGVCWHFFGVGGVTGLVAAWTVPG